MMSILFDELIKEDLITGEQLQDAKDKQLGAKKPLHEVLVDMGFLKEADLLRVAARVFKMPVSDLKEGEIDPASTKLIPYDMAKRYGVFPLRKEGKTLVVAMSNPEDVVAIDDLSIKTGSPLKTVLSAKSAIDRCMEKYYQSDDMVYDLLKNMVSEGQVEVIPEKAQGKEEAYLGDIGVDSSPVVRLMNLLLSDALKSRSSDIHIEPYEEFTEVRYRIDGDLKSIMKIPAKLHPALMVRLKILSELDISEKRKTQDGRLRVVIDGRRVDVRVSIIPTYHGEKAVLRLLDTKQGKVDLEKIGMPRESMEVFTDTITRPQGMILVTGPTGSGKTSTLYAVLNRIKSEAKNIITIEDPVEYLLDGINQIQLDPVKNVTFASGLRSILRQDPNVILVGEIRDKDTADIAFRASLTGHLVLSTVHTNSSVATITRLLDIGLEPYLISSSIMMIIAQRLVRLICPHCKEEYVPDDKVIKRFQAYLDKDRVKFYHGKGCDKCGYTGYMGRTAIFEVLPFNEKIRAIISAGKSEDVLMKQAREDGMRTLAESGLEKVAEGLTTLEELAKVVDVAEGPVEKPAVKPEKRERPLILIVDDEEDIRKVLGKRLEMAGYQVMTAGNGKAGIETAAREKPDLIIMDVMMPEMNGFEATEALRSKIETAVIPVIMLTAKQDKESELTGIKAGADDYLTKPFDKEKLLARIEMLLRRKARS